MNKKMKILIAYDGSSCADDALYDLRRAGLPPVAEALIVNVAEVWLPIPVKYRIAETAATATGAVAGGTVHHQPKGAAKPDEISEKTVDAAERLGSFFSEWNVKTEIMRGSPASALIHKAREWNADLIIAGSRGQCDSNRFWLGSVSQKIANEAPCSVRVTRSHGAWKNGAPMRILIGLDGTAAADAAVAEVAGRFWIIGSEVRLIVALDKSDPFFAALPQADKNVNLSMTNGKRKQLTWVSEFVDRAHEQLSRAELQVSDLIEEGNPKQIIVAEAEEWGADCIFIGAGEDGGDVQSLLLGSVSTAVLARAHCTVEIVRK